jgi:tetratricopeptide (TPR) repeat protein
MESLLFGHERGAFTGADRSRPGYFRTAHGGTILLDEIGTLSMAAQARLLQVVDEGLVPVLGLPTPIRIDVWVICATNVDLDEAVRERRFRADLLSRLTIRFDLPPLRQRHSDIIPLAEKFLAQACADFGLPLKKLSPAARERMERHAWPDNARGLRSMIENAVVFTSGTVIGNEDLGIGGLSSRPDSRARHHEIAVVSDGTDLRARHLDVLEQTGWNISRASKILGISRLTLRARIRRWELTAPSALRQQGEKPLPVVPRGLDRPQVVETGRDAPDRPEVGEDEQPAVDVAQPSARAEFREVRWERHWLGFLQFSLTAPDADDAMVTARPYLDVALEKVQQFGGHVVELWPTGLSAAFGLDAIEGSALRAASAALAIQIAASRVHKGTTSPPEWRIALHAMSCLVGSLGSAPQIDRDARRRTGDVLDALVAVSKTEGVVASGDIAPFLRRCFSLGAPLGTGPAGHARPVLGPSLHPGGFGEQLGTFVGRRAEIETLQARALLARQGSGQIVGVVGDPGVGKSRLVWEFAHAGPDRGWLVLDTASVPLGRPTPFFAVIDLLRVYFDVAPGEAADAVRDKVTRRLVSMDEALAPLLPVFLTLLDVKIEDSEWQMMEPSERRRQMVAGIRRLLLRESVRQPLLLVFEDTHWADAETRELLDEIADSIPMAPVVMLVTYRPEYQHAWGGRSFYTQLRVEPLRGESADRLVEELLGADASLATLRHRLTQWTDGNPFFIEEVVRTLSEIGVLKGQRGAYRLDRAVDAIVVPGTVEEVLASRITRLGPGPSELLRAAAVVGRQVPYAVLAAVSREPSQRLEAHLRALQSGEFVYQAGEGAEREYTFRHALTQEVAYGSLTDEERRTLHARAMNAMALVYEARADEKINELAHHAFEGRVWDRAVGYLRRAGRRAFARSANREAVECFTQALSALSHLPQDRTRQEEAFDLRFDLRSALWPLGEIDNMGQVLAEATDLARTLGDSRRQGLAAAARCHYGFLTSRHVEVVSAGEEAVRLARAANSPAVERDAMLYVGIVHGAMGDYARAVDLLLATLHAFEVAGTKLSARERVVSLPTARTYLARYLAELGELRQAASHAAAGLEAAEAGGGPWFLATTCFGMGSVEIRRGDFLAAISLLERALDLCQNHRLQSWFPSISASLGYAYVNAGRSAEGVALLEQAIGHAARMHLSASYSMWLTYLADSYLSLGRFAEARRSAQAALDHARKHGERGHEAWSLFLLASVAAGTGSATADEVETLFGPAIDLARTLGMRPLLAHCHAAQARAYAHLGRGDRASEERAQTETIREEIGMSGA